MPLWRMVIANHVAAVAGWAAPLRILAPPKVQSHAQIVLLYYLLDLHALQSEELADILKNTHGEASFWFVRGSKRSFPSYFFQIRMASCLRIHFEAIH
jgi:hypothetical protein